MVQPIVSPALSSDHRHDGSVEVQNPHDLVLAGEALEARDKLVQTTEEWLLVEHCRHQHLVFLTHRHGSDVFFVLAAANVHHRVVGDIKVLESVLQSLQIEHKRTVHRVQLTVEQITALLERGLEQLNFDYLAEGPKCGDLSPLKVGELAVLLEIFYQRLIVPLREMTTLCPNDVDVCISTRDAQLIGPDLEVEQLFVSDLLSLFDNSRLNNRERRSADSKNASKKRLEIVNYVAPTAAGRLIKNRAGLRKEYGNEQRRNYDKNGQHPQSGLLIFRHFAPPRSYAHICSLHFSVRSKSLRGEVAA